MIPLYGFLEGDTIGLIVLAYEHETIREIADKLQQSASLRVARRESVRVLYKGRVLDPSLTVGESALEPLERIDVVGESGS